MSTLEQDQAEARARIIVAGGKWFLIAMAISALHSWSAGCGVVSVPVLATAGAVGIYGCGLRWLVEQNERCP